MRRYIILSAVVLAAIVGSFTGCDTDDNTPVCYPQEKASCICRTGDPGERTCDDDGLGYGECSCRPDAGVDAAVDSP